METNVYCTIYNMNWMNLVLKHTANSYAMKHKPKSKMLSTEILLAVIYSRQQLMIAK